MLELAASLLLVVNSVCLLLLSMAATHSSQSSLRDSNNLAMALLRRLSSQHMEAISLRLPDKLPFLPLVLEVSRRVSPTCRWVDSSLRNRQLRPQLLANKGH